MIKMLKDMDEENENIRKTKAETFDKVIIGAGLYGLYAAILCGEAGESVLVLEYEDEPFKRATYINQARLHMGYHYPRSIATALKSASYFERFYQNYKECILDDFEQIYAVSSKFSYTNAKQFIKFCQAINIQCQEIPAEKFFKDSQCGGAFLTREYTYDAQLLKKKLLTRIYGCKSITLKCNVRIADIFQQNREYTIMLNDRTQYKTGFLLNTTYASVNQILRYLDYQPYELKYELCEIILCNTGKELKNLGITIMDGPFFSIMPFGKTGFHSLTSVTFTPHETSYNKMPIFECQKRCEPGYCSSLQLGNCNYCRSKPESAWPYMSVLAHKYLRDEFVFDYEKSLFSMKPILKKAENDDSRPTVIRVENENPKFVSVLSGKINTVFDLDEVLI